MKKAVKELRTELGLTQEQFAEKLGITRQADNAYENGKNGISPGIAAKIREVYGVDIAPVEIKKRIW